MNKNAVCLGGLFSLVLLSGCGSLTSFRSTDQSTGTLSLQTVAQPLTTSSGGAAISPGQNPTSAGSGSGTSLTAFEQIAAYGALNGATTSCKTFPILAKDVCSANGTPTESELQTVSNQLVSQLDAQLAYLESFDTTSLSADEKQSLEDKIQCTPRIQVQYSVQAPTNLVTPLSAACASDRQTQATDVCAAIKSQIASGTPQDDDGDSSPASVQLIELQAIVASHCE